LFRRAHNLARETFAQSSPPRLSDFFKELEFVPMTNNLVSLALNYLTPEMIARIASALGLDKAIAGKAVTAAVPALLKSFANVAATPDGARKLSGAISQQNSGILETLASSIGGAGQQDIVNSGVNTLGSLLGSSAVPAVADALGKYVGMGHGESKSLIGLLGPAVMGVIGKEQKAQGLDATGLANLLSAQKSNINAALPSGFADALKSTGLPHFAAAPQPSPAAKTSSSWLNWALGLLAAAAIAWWLFGNRATEVADQAKTTAGQVAENLTVDGIDLKSVVQTTLNDMTSALQSVSDEASAKTALPKLQSAMTELEKVRGLSAKLPTTGRSILATLVAAARPSIEDLFKKVLAIPGVETFAKPTVDQLRATLDDLAKA
jgi:hypothetical protein